MFVDLVSLVLQLTLVLSVDSVSSIICICGQQYVDGSG